MKKINIKEIWKDIPDYEGLYQVSNFGRIKRINYKRYDRNQIMKEKLLKQANCKGYLTVHLCKNGTAISKRVHRLVMGAFVGLSDLQIDHIDGNKKNNNITNLEYVTAKENTNRAWGMGLSKSHNKRKINQYDLNGNFIKTWDSVKDYLLSINKINYTGNISNCCNKKSNSAYGFKWEYYKND